MRDSQGIPRRRVLGYAAAASAAPALLFLQGGTASAAAEARSGAEPAGAPPMEVIWSTDFQDGWSGWQDTPWNDEPQGEVQRPTVVDSPTGQGKAGRFHLDGGQKRNESQPTVAQSIGEGDTLVVQFTDYLEDGFPVDTDDWQVILQFKNDSDGSPPCEIKVGHGQYFLDGDNGTWSRDIGPAVTGQEITIAVRVLFSANAGTAVIDAWHDGQQTVTGLHPTGAGTLYSGQSSYLKTGIYRDTAIGDAGTRYLTSLTIGTPA